MIHKNLSAWITDSHGTQLEEFQKRDVDDQTTECWIPSEEGANFQIMWQPTMNFEPRQELRCSILLDGRAVSAGCLSASRIARGRPGKKDGMTVALGLRRLFVFGRQEITDQDELASPENSRKEDLGTIQITLTWVRVTRGKRARRYLTPEEPGLLHERAAKKGHHTTAALGDLIPTPRPKSSKARVKVDSGLPPAVFVFRYGPREWLMAKEIIPNGFSQSIPRRKRNGSESKLIRPTKKCKREPSPAPATIASRSNNNSFESSEIIDIDDLESDPDSDIIVLSDPSTSSQAPAKLKSETKRMKSEVTLA
ncbi:hypothetical protein FRC12_008682 [Ceratobasidium sp. 428]|nr:hypothetical protein FRC12_008682 [Ceratobasidium sp. 428]